MKQEKYKYDTCTCSRYVLMGIVDITRTWIPHWVKYTKDIEVFSESTIITTQVLK